jgi:hypothetical protein
MLQRTKAAPSSRAAIGVERRPSFQTGFGGVAIQENTRAPDDPVEPTGFDPGVAMTAPFDAGLGGHVWLRFLSHPWKSFDLLGKSLENGWSRLENAWISLELTLISLSESSLFKGLRGPLGPFFYSPPSPA